MAQGRSRLSGSVMTRSKDACIAHHQPARPGVPVDLVGIVAFDPVGPYPLGVLHDVGELSAPLDERGEEVVFVLARLLEVLLVDHNPYRFLAPSKRELPAPRL